MDKVPFYVFQQRPFYSVKPGCRVVFDFVAEGSGELAVCLPQLVGRAYFAGLVQKKVELSQTPKRHKIILTVADLIKGYTPTTTRLGFGVLRGGKAKISGLRVSFESDKR